MRKNIAQKALVKCWWNFDLNNSTSLFHSYPITCCARARNEISGMYSPRRTSPPANNKVLKNVHFLKSNQTERNQNIFLTNNKVSFWVFFYMRLCFKVQKNIQIITLGSDSLQWCRGAQGCHELVSLLLPIFTIPWYLIHNKSARAVVSKLFRCADHLE